MGAMNELINEATVMRLVRQLGEAGVDALPHVTASATQLGDLNLRARSDLVSAALLDDLGDYASIAALFRRALLQPDFAGWIIWPVGETVTTAAIRDDAFDDALVLQAELTPRLSSEFAIRRLLAHDLARALPVIQAWTRHPNEHVRRLASEGTRSYLPWAIRVPSLLAHPEATIPILDALYRDDSEYVRRSVANHLNDLARTHPDLVVETAGRWMRRPDANTPRLVRHALRTLLKKGHPATLALLGYAPAAVAVTTPMLADLSVGLPGQLEFTFDVTNEGPEPATLSVDYAIHYVKSNGSRAAKVFKLASRSLAPGEVASFSKRHDFRQMTTRVHYPGTHALEVQVNGERFGLVEFEVVG